jgi:N-terminal domain of toast_rack, DUF2154
MASPPVGPPRHSSFVGPVILILVGVFFLFWTLYPGFDPWPWLLRYWPVILIAIGLGKIWDSYYAHQHPERATSPWITGTGLAWIILILLFTLVFWHGRHLHRWGWDDSWSEPRGEKHDAQAVELQGAKSVSVDVEFPAGRLEATGGSNRLLDADFGWYGVRPTVDYAVAGGHGQLTLTGKSNVTPFGTTDNNWHLRFGGDVPMDFNLNVGAGETYLRFDQIDLQRLNVHMGAGRLDLNLTGARKSNLDADIEGGVGSAMIRLPKDVGVRVEASGGIGSVNVDGFHREGGTYENDAYGKTPTSIEMTVHGGVGEIDLVEQ